MAVRKYIYDGDHVLLETDGVERDAAGVHGNIGCVRRPPERIRRHECALLRARAPLGSPKALTDASQAVTDRWRFPGVRDGDAHQRHRHESLSRGSVGKGYHSDSETGFYLLGSGTRHYDPVTAQFLSDDPIGFAGRGYESETVC